MSGLSHPELLAQFRVYLSPQAFVKLGRDVYLRLGVQLPVVKSLNGDQDEKVNVLTGITVRM